MSERRIQKLCEENRVMGAVRFGYAWAIPKDAEKPADARKNLKVKSKGDSWNAKQYSDYRR
ncbi:DNA-binding protein [Oscillibacter sp.]|uniref:DNA-binding protein n=1 Tax=Oscillibacter sp. TaxID=1945593 RepID=UPI0028A6880C|nr:DNA-binding protein [Oscillibacter sp.]